MEQPDTERNPMLFQNCKSSQFRENFLEVSGLDILDGTPVIDIKKKIAP